MNARTIKKRTVDAMGRRIAAFRLIASGKFVLRDRRWTKREIRLLAKGGSRSVFSRVDA